MIEPAEALELLRRAVEPLPAHTVPLSDAHRCVLASAVRSGTDLPPFRQSAVDGYALRVADLGDAMSLPVGEAIAAAPREAFPTLSAGSCARIFTGGPVPSGADAVVMQEDVEREGDVATFTGDIRVGQHIREQGEEVGAGDEIVASGTRMDAARRAAVSMAGVDRVTVSRRPRVIAWVGGDEIVSPGVPLRPGQVYDANGPLLESWFAEHGLAVDVRRLPDSLDATRTALRESFDDADLVVTTGGVSVGDHDHIVPAAEAEGAERVFWRVAQKPGKPLYVARHGASMLVGLPGNPGAVFVGLSLYVKTALDALEGAIAPGPRWELGMLERPMAIHGRHRFVRVRARPSAQGVTLSLLPRQASHMISNLAACDALAWVPPSDAPIREVRWTATRW